MNYENQRIVFNKILQKYKDYMELYRGINNGSIEGVTPFHQFYWHFTYYSKYAPSSLGSIRRF